MQTPDIGVPLDGRHVEVWNHDTQAIEIIEPTAEEVKSHFVSLSARGWQWFRDETGRFGITRGIQWDSAYPNNSTMIMRPEKDGESETRE